MFSKDQQQDVRTSSPSLSRAISYTLFGLPFVGGGVMLALTPFTSNGQSGALVGTLFGALMFLGGGGWIWWKAYKGIRRWKTYGTSHLQMESAPVPLGSSFRARLRAPISADEQPPNGFQVRVAATRESGDDEEVAWENWTSVRGKQGTGETAVPLSLDLPARPLPDYRMQMAEDTPWSSAEAVIEGLDWALEVTASFDDKPDYEASFDLPVSVPNDLDEQAEDDSSSGGSISSSEPSGSADEAVPTDAPDEKEVYWGVGDDSDEANLRHADSDPETSGDEDKAFSEPVSPGISLMEPKGKGLTLTVEHARGNSGYYLAGVGTLFFGLGMLMLFGAISEPLFFIGLLGLLFALAGGLALRGAWTRLTHASTVRVANGQVEVQKGPFFLETTPTRFPCDALADTKVKATAGSGNKSYYSLLLVKNGTGSKDDIPVAGMLANKEEAEWMAARIREVAEQEAAA